MGGVTLYGLNKYNEVSINILTFMCVFQNFILILFSQFLNSTSYTIFVLLKEMYVWALIIIGLIKKKRISYFNFGCLLCILAIVVYAVINNSGSLSGTLVSVRQLYLPFVFILLGSAICKSQLQIDIILKYFVKLMFICVVFGFIEMALKDQFWINLGFSSYAKLKSIDSGLTFDTGVYGAFYSWDLGIRLRRMVSFMADPVILGQLFAFALIISIYYKGIFEKEIYRRVSIVLFALGLLLTIAKGGILIALYTFAFVLGKMWRDKGLSFIVKMCFIAILIIGIAYTFHPETTSNGTIHIGGLIENVKNFSKYPMGRGVGSVGNLGYTYGGRGTLNANGESFIGTVIGQMGLVGIFIFGWFYFSLFKKIKKATKGTLYGIGNIILYLNMGLFITSLLSNTAISFTSCFIYYITAGGFCKVYYSMQNSGTQSIRGLENN